MGDFKNFMLALIIFHTEEPRLKIINSTLNFFSILLKEREKWRNNLIYHFYSDILQKRHIVSPGLQSKLAILICHILRNQPNKILQFEN